MSAETTQPPQTTSSKDIHLGDYLVTLPVVGVLGLVANWIGPGNPIIESIPGMFILLIISFVGLVVTRYAPFELPAVAWVTLVAMVVTLPWTPGSDWILAQLESADFLALATAVLAYAALSIGHTEIDIFKRAGWKIIIIAVLVFFGTFIGSAVIAEVTLRIQGII